MNQVPGTEYRVQLKTSNLKTAWTTGLLLSVLAIIILLTRFLGAESGIANMIAAILIIVWIVISVMRKRRKYAVSFSPVFILTALVLILIPPFHFLGLAYLILPLVEQVVNRPVSVLFGDNGISLKNGLYTRNYPWAAFSNIVLKDGLLTMDFNNNHLLQKETAGSNQIPEEEFNRYCLQKLTK